MRVRKADADADVVSVAPASEMLMSVFIRHTILRHPDIGMRSRENHDKDHALNGASLDHVHEE